MKKEYTFTVKVVIAETDIEEENKLVALIEDTLLDFNEVLSSEEETDYILIEMVEIIYNPTEEEQVSGFLRMDNEGDTGSTSVPATNL